jgi:hypothetical protein
VNFSIMTCFNCKVPFFCWFNYKSYLHLVRIEQYQGKWFLIMVLWSKYVCISVDRVNTLLTYIFFLLCDKQVYYVYGFMLLVFLILTIVTVCVTIVGTYFLLNAENYHWQWTSFFSAASTSVYVYLYSIYYYYVKTKMSGFFQTSFYFGYTLMFSLGLGILCGKSPV